MHRNSRKAHPNSDSVCLLSQAVCNRPCQHRHEVGRGIIYHVADGGLQRGDDGFDQVLLQEPPADLALAGRRTAGEQRAAVLDDRGQMLGIVDQLREVIAAPMNGRASSGC